MANRETLAYRKSSKAILFAGLLVGTLDIIAAVGLTLARGSDPIVMLRFIASGVFGSHAFSGPWLYPILGLLFHYCIALFWTLLFFSLAKKLPFLLRNWIATGIMYGISIWIVMNLIVLPLSRTPPISLRWGAAVTGMVVLVVAIGMPLAVIAARDFRRRTTFQQ